MKSSVTNSLFPEEVEVLLWIVRTPHLKVEKQINVIGLANKLVVLSAKVQIYFFSDSSKLNLLCEINAESNTAVQKKYSYKTLQAEAYKRLQLRNGLEYIFKNRSKYLSKLLPSIPARKNSN